MSVLKKLLVVSRYAKALEHMSTKEAFTSIPEKDKAFLQSLVMFLERNRDNFVAECQKPFSEDDEDNVPYARKFCSLITVLCSNYELLLIQPTQESAALFRLMKDCAGSQNQRIAIHSLDFWESFYETITTTIENLKEYAHLFKEFQEVAQITLYASAKLQSIPYHELEAEEIDELEMTERGVQLPRFREQAGDVLMRTYGLLERYYGNEGADIVLQMILRAL